MATPEPLAVGKCLASVMPETWTKSMPACRAISVNRKGLTGTACVQFARTGFPVLPGRQGHDGRAVRGSGGEPGRPREPSEIVTRRGALPGGSGGGTRHGRSEDLRPVAVARRRGRAARRCRGSLAGSSHGPRLPGGSSGPNLPRRRPVAPSRHLIQAHRDWNHPSLPLC